MTLNPIRAILPAVILTAFVVSAASSPAIAEGERIDWQVISGGGDRQSSASYILNFTVGQTATGTVASSNFRVKQGYWQDFVQSCCVARVVTPINRMKTSRLLAMSPR
ncbi:MAG: hypothetical protein AB1772_07630 [Candidatus Zixiibacteriota bacterium]